MQLAITPTPYLEDKMIIRRNRTESVNGGFQTITEVCFKKPEEGIEDKDFRPYGQVLRDRQIEVVRGLRPKKYTLRAMAASG